MNLKEFLIEYYDLHDLKGVARRMELSDIGPKDAQAERIARAFVEWVPDCMTGETLHQLCEHIGTTKLKQASARLTSNIEGSEKELFDEVARKIPEIADKAEDWLFPPHLRFVLMSCYGRRGLQRIAKEMELDSSGNDYSLTERISRCVERLAREEDSQRILKRLRKEANEDDMRSICEQLGISTEGGKKKVFKRLSTKILELDRLTKPEYFRKLEAKTSGAILAVAEENAKVADDDKYSR